MIQPFKPEHIRRYLLLYGGIVVLMILFYAVNTVVNPAQVHERKVFNTENNETAQKPQTDTSYGKADEPSPFKLLPER